MSGRIFHFLSLLSKTKCKVFLKMQELTFFLSSKDQTIVLLIKPMTATSFDGWQRWFFSALWNNELYNTLVIYGKRKLRVQTTANLRVLPFENQERKKKVFLIIWKKLLCCCWLVLHKIHERNNETECSWNTQEDFQVPSIDLYVFTFR